MDDCTHKATLRPPAPTIEHLRQQIARAEVSTHKRGDTPLSSGWTPLDDILPDRGIRRGALIEWLSAGAGSGGATLALGSAVEACRDGGALVVFDPDGWFYPPAAARFGVELERLVVVQPASAADAAWALDQALRCPGVAAALAWPERLDARDFRRLQLAAESAGTVGLLVRPAAVRHEPSWADVRWLIEPRPGAGDADRRRLRVHLLRCRGGAADCSIDVELDDETRTLHLAEPLAAATPRRRAARA